MCIPTRHPVDYGYRKNEYQHVAASSGSVEKTAIEDDEEPDR